MSASINRSIATVKTELQFLLDSKVITQNFYDQTVGTLPAKYTEGAAPVDFATSKAALVATAAAAPVAAPVAAVAAAPVSNPAPVAKQTPSDPEKAAQAASEAPSGPPPYSDQEFAEAVYAYQPQQAEDLQLHVGDKIAVTQKLSASWWRGTCNGRAGIFPANYVKPLGSQPATQTRSEKPSQNAFPYQQYQQQQQIPVYEPVQQQQQVVGYQQQPVQQQQPAQEQPAQQEHHHPHMSGLASRLGSAAIFGAGATVGSNIVNSIF